MSFTFIIIKNEMLLVSQTKLVSDENIQVLLPHFYLLFQYYVILPYQVKRTRKIRGRNTL